MPSIRGLTLKKDFDILARAEGIDGLRLIYALVGIVVACYGSVEHSSDRTEVAIRCLQYLSRLESADEVLRSYPCIELLIHDLRLEGWRRIAIRAESNQRLKDAQQNGVPNEKLAEMWMDAQRALLDLTYEHDCDEPRHTNP